ncbi:hypothetical protein EE091_09600 [Staphylococcus aureus]|nr:hypothetical protein EE091_09600 [Staphylococcus aureus]
MLEKVKKIINLIKKIIHLLRVKLVLTELSIIKKSKNKHRLMKNRLINLCLVMKCVNYYFGHFLFIQI